MDCSLCDKVFLTVDFDSYMSKEHKNHWAQIRKAIYSSIFNLFKMAAKTEKSEFKSSIKLCLITLKSFRFLLILCVLAQGIHFWC